MPRWRGCMPASRARRCRASRTKAFSSEVETGSRQENASNQESRGPPRFHRSAKGSRVEPTRGPSMPRFAANLSLMFTEVPFLDRFDAAAKAGFTAVEFLFPYDFPADAIGKRLRRNDLTQALFNLAPGNWEAGEKGFAALPDRFADLQQSVRTALPYANATGVKRLHLMAGIANRGDPKAVAAFRKSVAWAVEIVERPRLRVL